MVVKRTIPVTPLVVHQRYNITSAYITRNPKNQQAVVEFTQNFFNPNDLQLFFSQFWPNRNFNDSVKRVIGTNNPEFPSIQTSTDLQYTMGVAPNMPTWVWLNNGIDFWSDLTAFVSQLSSIELACPNVIAISYGNEGEGPSQEYRERMSMEFAKIGGRGITLLAASGDFGTGCNLCYWFQPSFPASSILYATSILTFVRPLRNCSWCNSLC